MQFDKADPASSSPSPWRFPCAAWLVFLPSCSFHFKKTPKPPKIQPKKPQRQVLEVLPWRAELSLICVELMCYITLSHHCAILVDPWFGSAVQSHQLIGWDKCENQPAHLRHLSNIYFHRGKIRTGLKTCRIRDLNALKWTWNVLAHTEVVWVPGGSHKCIKPHLLQRAGKK